MLKQLPLRIFHSVSDLHIQWQVPSSAIRQWLAHGQIRAHIWVPMASLYEVAEELDGNRVILTKVLRHYEGYLQLFPHDCRKLMSRQKLEIHDFTTLSGHPTYSVPETAHGITVQLTDLVIMEKERKRFEIAHGLGSKDNQRGNENSEFDPSFKLIQFGGEIHRFGEIQAKIFRRLFEVARNDDCPWLNGKRLLASVGSKSFTIGNVFKRRSIWQCLIESDQRGSYRLHPAFLESIPTELDD